MKIRALWDMTPCRVQKMSGYRSYRGACCLHLQGVSSPTTDFLHPEEGVSKLRLEMSITTVFVNQNGVNPEDLNHEDSAPFSF
jgi:hypothetical protein